jgi:hypothetical protein
MYSKVQPVCFIHSKLRGISSLAFPPIKKKTPHTQKTKHSSNHRLAYLPKVITSFVFGLVAEIFWAANGFLALVSLSIQNTHCLLSGLVYRPN